MIEIKTSQGRISRDDDGFSLVEMLVSIVIFLIVTGAIWSVLSVARQSSTTVNRSVELSKTVRVGMNLLGRDTYNAGFGYPFTTTVWLPDNRVSALLGIPNDSDTTRDTVPPIIAGNNITLNSFNATPNVKTDQVTFFFKDSTFNRIGPTEDEKISTPISINIAAAPTGTGIDEIVPLSGSNDMCGLNDIYMIAGGTGAMVGMATKLIDGADGHPDTVQFANNDKLKFNLTGPTGPMSTLTLPASLYRIKIVTYFVTADGTLTRREYGNYGTATAPNGYVDEPLVYGVENFQIKYVMEDGALSDNPSAGGNGTPGDGDDDAARLMAVRQVRFIIDARSIEPGPDGSFARTSMTSIFSTRNLGYDAN